MVGRIPSQQTSVLCALRSSPTVGSVGSVVSFTVFSGVVSTNMCCRDLARMMIAIPGISASMSESSVPSVLSRYNASAG